MKRTQADVYKNNELKKLGPKRNKVTTDWMILYDENLRDLLYLTSFIRMTKQRTMRWTEHVVCMGRKRW